MKVQEREEARRLRKENGLSLSEIARQLKVSKGTVSAWVRDIELTKEQAASLNKNQVNNWHDNGKRKKEAALQNRIKYQDQGREEAKKGNPLHRSACMLYWAEGSKLNNRSTVRFVNSDPEMIKLFIKFLREYCHVPDDKILISLQYYSDNTTEKEVESFWRSVTGLPQSCYRKHSVDAISSYSKGKRAGKSKYGTCRISVYSVQLQQRLLGAIQEYGAFDRPEYLQ